MFIERLGKEKFEKLVLKFFQQKGAEIKKFDELYIVEHNEYGVIISSKSKLPFIRRIEFNDFYAKYDIAGGFALPTHAKDKSQILRDYLYKKFGEKYLNALKARLEEDKNKKLEELKNLIEEENKKVIEELTKKEFKNSNDIYEDMLDKFQADLDRFSTAEEKVAYLKSFGFAVDVKKENPENLEK